MYSASRASSAALENPWVQEEMALLSWDNAWKVIFFLNNWRTYQPLEVGENPLGFVIGVVGKWDLLIGYEGPPNLIDVTIAGSDKPLALQEVLSVEWYFESGWARSYFHLSLLRTIMLCVWAREWLCHIRIRTCELLLDFVTWMELWWVSCVWVWLRKSYVVGNGIFVSSSH